jgi:hypothetical protein
MVASVRLRKVNLSSRTAVPSPVFRDPPALLMLESIGLRRLLSDSAVSS